MRGVPRAVRAFLMAPVPTFHVLLVGCASTIGVLLAWWVA